MTGWQERYRGPWWVVARRRAALVGRVVDGATGAPLAGALVTVIATSAASGARLVCRADGSFVALTLPSGTYTLVAAAPHLGGRFGEHTVTGVVVPPAGEAARDVVELRLPPTGVAGVISAVGANGAAAPLEGALVRLVGHGAAQTGKDGAFVLSGAPAGQQVLEVAAEGFRPLRAALDLRAGETASYTATLEPDG